MEPSFVQIWRTQLILSFTGLCVLLSIVYQTMVLVSLALCGHIWTHKCDRIFLYFFFIKAKELQPLMETIAFSIATRNPTSSSQTNDQLGLEKETIKINCLFMYMVTRTQGFFRVSQKSNRIFEQLNNVQILCPTHS